MRKKKTLGSSFGVISRLSMVVLFVFNASCGTLKDLADIASQSTDVKSLALAGTQKLFTPKTLPNYPQDPLQDDTITNYAIQVRKNLDSNAVNKGLGITILKTAKVNGMSNGSEIQITRGMLNMMGSEAELACLIGHEIGHMDLNHLGKVHDNTYQDSAASKGIVLIGKTLGEGDAAGTANLARNNLVVANFGQKLEQDADEYGAILAAKGGYDPYAFVDLFNRLAQKRGIDFAVKLNGLTEGHKTSDVRAEHLLKFLKAKGYEPGKGFRREKEFRTAMADLASIHTGEGGERTLVLTDDEKKELAGLDQVQAEIQKFSESGESMGVKRFLELMAKLSDSCRKHGIKRGDVQGANSNKIITDKNFMDDDMEQDSPHGVDDPHKPDYETRIKNSIKHLVVGKMPLGKNIIGLDEAVTGKDFYSGKKLSPKERTLAAIGGVAVETGASESLDAKVRALDTAVNIKSYGDSIQSIAKDLSNEIDQNTQSSLREAGKILDKGSNWKRVDTDPGSTQDEVYQMKTNSDQTYYRVDTKNGSYLLDHNPNANDNLGEDVQDVERVQVSAGTSLKVFQENGRIINKK